MEFNDCPILTGVCQEGPTGAPGEDGSATLTGATGPQGLGIRGDTGAASTVTGPTGAASTVPGPTGERGGVGAPSTVPGPAGATGAASAVTGPTGDRGGIGPRFDGSGPYWRAGLDRGRFDGHWPFRVDR